VLRLHLAGAPRRSAKQCSDVAANYHPARLNMCAWPTWSRVPASYAPAAVLTLPARRLAKTQPLLPSSFFRPVSMIATERGRFYLGGKVTGFELPTR